jgi:hypothetical protein
MKSKPGSQKSEARRKKAQPSGTSDPSPAAESDASTASEESDESELEDSDLDSDLDSADDDCWDVFIFDDDCDPLPDYGDFWFPDGG